VTEPELDLDYYRKKLLRIRDELSAVAETGKEAAATVELDQSKVGRLSRMDALQAQAMSAASNRRREMQLQSIAKALTRIQNQEFGWCDECGAAIAPQRLEFDPSVESCIECAQKREE
jgi:DnaK suppressor protein